jgi:ribosomal protein S18 acetylase RimI-like enzyme
MSEIVIDLFRECPLRDKEAQLREIFFESSARKNFNDDAEREIFYQKYLGSYLMLAPDLTFVCWESKLLGYITGILDSDATEISSLQPHLTTFKDLFQRFPAHLHINMHHEARGRGIGSKLLIEFEKKIKLNNVFGVHLITSPSSRNCDFYRKNGYTFEAERSFLGTGLLFMGKSL